MKYMLDTNVCVYIIRNKSPKLLQKLAQHSPSDVCISSITAAELQYGVHKSSQPDQNQQALDQFLIPLAIMDFNHRAALEYGRTRAYLERSGTSIGALDTLIAAHALAEGLTLVTSNVGEFSRVPGLSMVDWSSS
jgi:tRNA(fMet)-specific endonuclease VapC